MGSFDEPYEPTMPPEAIARLRDWHEGAYRSLSARSEPQRVECLGRSFTVHPQVFPPAGELLARAVLDEIQEGDRVLDVGTGSGVNAILAATVSQDVVAVDVNPHALSCAVANAADHGVAQRVAVVRSDVFEHVDGKFDLIVFDPPFRWFAPRDVLELAITDENYQVLTRFMREAPNHLSAGGRILLHFGTSADLAYLYQLVDRLGYAAQTIASAHASRDGQTAEYYVFKLRR